MISEIFKLLGPPSRDSWPGYCTLPLPKKISLPPPQPPQFRQKFPFIGDAGVDLLMKFLTCDPECRITAEGALQHPYFKCVPLLLAWWT
jgi:cell division cycle 2-like